MELRTKARRLQAEAGLDLVIVDYLQLMQATTTNRDANRVQEVSEISRGLKALARELSIPVIALVAAVAASRRCASRRSRGCRTCASRARSSRTPTSSCSCGATRSAARTTRTQDGEVINLEARQAPQRPDRRDPALVQEAPDAVRLSYAGERFAEAG